MPDLSRMPRWLTSLPFAGQMAVAAAPGPDQALTCFFNHLDDRRLPDEFTWNGDGHAISYLLAGAGTLMDAEGVEHAVAPGMMYQYHLGRSSRFRYHTGGDFRECCLYLPPRRVGLLRGLGVLDIEEQVLRTGPMRAIADSFLDLYQAILAWPPSSATRLLRLLGDLLDLLDRGRQPADASSAIERFRAAIDQRYDERLSLEDLTAELGLSYHELRTRFRRTYGMSPGDFRIHRRIEEAKRLLASSTVQEAARRLGYSDPFAFSRQFRQRTGMTPTQFRERRLPGTA